MNEIEWGPRPEPGLQQEPSIILRVLLIIGATFAAAGLVLVFFLALFTPEPEPAYTPDECTPEPDGFCATWHDYHENDWELK